MKRSFKQFFILPILILSGFLQDAIGQQSLINVSGWNAYVHVPASYYSNPTVSYPTIIFFPGIGEVGTNPASVISNGPGAYIAQGWNGNVTIDGRVVEFIVISLQTATAYPNEDVMNAKIQQLKGLYRMDPNRLYLTGLSHGGWCATTFVSGDNYGGPYTYAGQVAAVVSVEGVTPRDNAPYPNMFDNFANAGGRYLGFEQVNDFRDTKTVVDRMNLTKPNSAIYVQTNFNGGWHCCWNSFYGGQSQEPVKFNLDGINQNLYEWLARQSKGTVLPPTNMAPSANAGTDQTIYLPTTSTSLSGSGFDADGSIVSYAWTKVSGPAGGTISSPNTAFTTIQALQQGVYEYKLTVTDNAGATGSSNVKITVNPAINIPPVAIAGPDQTITLPVNIVTLNGSASYDPDGVITAYNWKLINGPGTVNIANEWLAVTTASFSTAGTYSFRLDVGDAGGLIGRDTIIVTVLNQNPVPPPPPPPSQTNTAPIAVAGPDAQIFLPRDTLTVDGSGSYDLENNIVAHNWKFISGPGTVTFDNEWVAKTVAHFPGAGIYTLRLDVGDSFGLISSDLLVVTVSQAIVNNPPVANAGPDKNIQLPANSTTLNGSGTDTDGTIVSYSWTKISGPNGSALSAPNSATTNVTGLTAGQFVYRLTVTDNAGATAFDDVTINVSRAANIPPVANAGPDKNVQLPANSTTLNGSGTDTDGTIVSYSWTKISGPNGSALSAPNSATTNVTGLTAGQFIYRLMVTDDSGASAYDDVIITVTAAANIPPLANAGPDKNIQLPANSTTLNGSGTDADGTIVSYNWTKISGPNGSALSAPNSATTNVTGLTAGQFVYRLTVTDNAGATAYDEVTITVSSAANIPPLANAGPDINVQLPTNSTTLNGSGTDADGTIVSYSWTKISGPNGSTLSAANSATTQVNNLIEGQYVYRLMVTDNNGASNYDDVTIKVSAASNLAPIANAGNDITIQLPTNTVSLSGAGSSDADGTITSYHWTQVTGTAATIVSPTAMNTTVSFSLAGNYTFNLQVTDNAGLTANDQVVVTVLAAPVVTGNKQIKVNIFDAENSFNNTQWNNWKPEAWMVSKPFKYSDGSLSPVTGMLTSAPRFVDNGVNYASGSTACPSDVLRINSIDAGKRYLILSNLVPNHFYTLEFYASRAYTGNQTTITVGAKSDTINTDYNVNDFAQFVRVMPSGDGTIRVTINNIAVYNYLAGFMITDETQVIQPPVSDGTLVSKNTGVTGTVQDEQEAKILAFPNPFGDQLSVTLDKNISGNYKISLVAMNGTVVWSKQGTKQNSVSRENISTAHLPAGIYIMQVQNNQKNYSYKLMKR